MKKYLPATFLLAVVFMSCGNNSNKTQNPAGNNTTQEKTRTVSAESSNTKIKNNIALSTKEVQVSQAFLLYEDGKLVPEGNQAAVGQPVRMRLVIDGGWKENNGTVSLGASERIETSDGLLVLDEKDLFASLPTIPVADSKFITLTATISRMDQLYDYFLVSCRVWDKNGTGEINASYKLYIK